MVGPDFSLYEGLEMSGLPDYFFHKAGMINFSRYAAAVLGPAGIRANTISPWGWTLGKPTRVSSNATPHAHSWDGWAITPISKV